MSDDRNAFHQLLKSFDGSTNAWPWRGPVVDAHDTLQAAQAIANDLFPDNAKDWQLVVAIHDRIVTHKERAAREEAGAAVDSESPIPPEGFGRG